MKNDNSVGELLDTIREVEESDEKAIPFVFLDGSSGTGKTQMAFNLMAASLPA